MAIEQVAKEQCGVGTACCGCGRRLPLRLSQGGEEASLWECVHCQTPFAGVLSPEVLRMLSRRIRLAPLHFDVNDVEPLTDAVLQVVWRNASRAQRGKFATFAAVGASPGSAKSSPCAWTSDIA